MAHPLAGQPVKREDLIQVDTVVKDFFRIVPTYDHVGGYCPSDLRCSS